MERHFSQKYKFDHEQSRYIMKGWDFTMSGWDIKTGRYLWTVEIYYDRSRFYYELSQR